MSALYSGLDRLPSPSCIIDVTGTIRYVNAAWNTGSEPRAPVGAHATELVAARGAKGDGTRLGRAIAALLDGDGERHEEIVTLHRAAGERWLALHAIAVPIGGERCVLLAEHDVTAAHLDERRRVLASALGAASLAPSADERLRRSLEAIVSTLGWTTAVALWLDEATGHLVGDRRGPRVPSSLPAHTGLLGYAFDVKAPRWFADAHDPDVSRLRAALALPLGIEAPLYTVPLALDGRLGIAAFFLDEAVRPDDATLRLVEGALAPPSTLDPDASIADRFVARAAEHDAPVLVVGEAGAGKSFATRRLHALSSRRRGPLVVLSATRLELSFDLTLFGDARAALPALRRGVVDAARAGTLVIEEVDALDENSQGVLARLLERGAFRRRGATDETPLDARIVATSRTGRLTPRLAALFAPFEVTIPSVETRRAELPALVDELLAARATRASRAARWRVDDAALDELRRRALPGNIAELESLLGAAIAALPDGATVIGADLLPRTDGAPPSSLIPLVERERDHIQGVLVALRYNVRRASQILGISRTTLYEKIRAYDIDLKTARQTVRPHGSHKAPTKNAAYSSRSA
jgi:hypothetical protein